VLRSAADPLPRNVNVRAALAMQRTVGNRATGRVLSATRRDSAPVQRLAEEEIGELATVQRQSTAGTGTDAAREAERALSRDTSGQAVLAPGSLSLFNFVIDGAELKPFHIALLREFADFLTTEATVDSVVRISGHTDSSGPDSHNATLSGQRARVVADFLRGTGLTVEITSAGEASPIASNETVDGRSRNRRVDVTMSATPRRRTDPDPDHPHDPSNDPPRRDLCDRYPILCGLTPVFPLIPAPWPLLCVLAPELCIALPCMVNPALCTPPVPPNPPDGPNDPDRPDTDPDGGTPHVEFGPVRAPNTPAAMPDRIPDQGAFPVVAVVTGHAPDQGPILVQVANANSANGTADIDGAPATNITGTTVLGVAGTQRTAMFTGTYNLFLEATLNGAVIGRSRVPFAVVPIMENMHTSFSRKIVDDTGASMFAAMSWQSDGQAGMASLDGLEYQEHLFVAEEEGGMIGLGPGLHGNLVLASLEQEDQHGTEMERMNRPGRQKLIQTHAMIDHRGGATDIPISSSGFSIVRETAQDPDREPGCLLFRITKTGEAGEADGIRSGAGTGNAVLRVPLPCDNGGGGGTSPATPTIPTPFFGPTPAGTTPIRYEGGIRANTAVGELVELRFSFRLGSEVFVSMVPCMVIAVSRTAVRIESMNPVPVNVAPAGRQPVVMEPGKLMDVPKALLR
jgi:outer membrane protein OmpA-like peptidoglycan-associated protein